MRILYIEDEISKANSVMKVINDEYPRIQLSHCRSYNSGVNMIRNEKFDVILLDMSLPIYDADKVESYNNEFETFGGIDILEEVNRLELESKVIIITAFDVLSDKETEISLEQLDLNMKDEFPDEYICSIHYNSSSLEWKRILLDEVKKIKGECTNVENTNC
ncbi:response regulator [Acidaminobacter sp. JC074]|uniref:hypothetical protein n=1 Tax=Acidaminobacter sp. JC074 TaxID=2530199 RepID=UPI001F0DF75C|nr:hypothetical protein [Acidaminobacter sp. JC074]MCH4891402.1 response regulator [Acidaminobacter sp. JC074]